MAACSQSTPEQKANSDYDKLCKIFEDIAPKPLSPAVKGMDLAERIEKELPKFYQRDYQNIILLDRNQAYQTIKEIAESETKKPWDCQVMRDYYSGKYDQAGNAN
jgi:hypothetical protein